MNTLDHVEKHMRNDFFLGENDCCISACNVFRSIHGIDLMKDLRGEYDDIESAKAIISRWGGWLTMTEALANAAGLDRTNNSECHDGAIALSRQGKALGPDGRALLIGLGVNLWAAKTTRGYAIIKDAHQKDWVWAR